MRRNAGSLAGVGLAIAAAMGALACSRVGFEGQGNPDNPAADRVPDRSVATGSPCAQNQQCQSGFCSGVICCEVACDDPCLACSAAGRCEPSSGRLMVSLVPDRSSARPLTGARLAGTFNVFTQTCQPVSQVTFYWETQQGQPMAVEQNSPYDLSGTTQSLPNYLSTLVVPKGVHTLIGVGLSSATGLPLAPMAATATYEFPADGPGQEMLMYSLDQSRINPQPLHSAVVWGTIYVFLAPGTFPMEPLVVSFYLDEPTQSSLANAEAAPPYDLRSGSVCHASPLLTPTLSNGQHTLQAVYPLLGLRHVVQAQFSVAN